MSTSDAQAYIELEKWITQACIDAQDPKKLNRTNIDVIMALFTVTKRFMEVEYARRIRK
jgi:hypothetical protein